MSAGEWQTVPPGTQYRGFGRGPSGTGTAFVRSSPIEYQIDLAGSGRTLFLGRDANGDVVSVNTSDKLIPTPFDYKSRNQVQFDDTPDGLMRWAVRQMVDRRPIDLSPADIFATTPPEGAVGWEWEDDAWVDYDLDFGPWTTDDPRVVEPFVQGGDGFGQTDIGRPTSESPVLPTQAATFTFKVATFPTSAMTLGPGSDSTQLFGTGPNIISLPGVSQAFTIPPRAAGGPRVTFQPDPVSVTPVAGEWLAVGVYADWWPNAFAGDPYRHTALAGFTVTTFEVFRDPWPRYRWRFPAEPIPNRYGWGVLLA